MKKKIVSKLILHLFNAQIIHPMKVNEQVQGGDDSKSECRKAEALACMCGSVTLPEIQ